IVVAFGYLINIYLLPHSQRMFKDLQWEVRNNHAQILLQEGAFNQISKNVTVYVRERTSDGQLRGILVHDTRDEEKINTYIAERGAMLESDKGPRVVMYNANRQEVDPQTHQFSILYFDRYIYNIDQNSDAVGDRFREARERTVYELFHLEEDPNIGPHNIGKFTVEGHKRLISPITILGFGLIGMAILISGSFSRRSQWKHIVLASIIVVALFGAMMALENATAKNLSLVPVLYVLGFLPVVGGYIYMLHSPKIRGNKQQMVSG
ncbi:MAG: LptF/LptG family permease, partial [Planctomycetes bacterium]|nr:LptF/LptG family permease [Planctomycetota bacterium]